MVDKKAKLSEANLRFLLDSAAGMINNGNEPLSVGNMLVRETVRFRDKLKQETGEILTVGDTRVALEALEVHLNGGELPEKLTPEQRALTQIWIDRLTLFGAE